MADIKSFPPSEMKLRHLRAAGIVPVSLELNSFAVIVGVFIAIVIFISFGWQQISEFADVSFRGGLETAAPASQENALLKTSFQTYCTLTLVLIAPIVCVVLLAGAVQTKFLIAFSALRIDFGRMFSPGFNFRGRLLAGTSGLLKALFWASAAAALLYYVFSEFVPGASMILRDVEVLALDSTAVNNTLESSLLSVKQVFLRFWFTAIAFSFFVGVLSRFIVVLNFQREHGMTRAEVEAEYQQTEVSPDMRRAVSERLGEGEESGG